MLEQVTNLEPGAYGKRLVADNGLDQLYTGRRHQPIARGVLAERLDALEDARHVVGFLPPDHANALTVNRLDEGLVSEH